MSDHEERITTVERRITTVERDLIADAVLLNSFREQLGHVQQLFREMRLEIDALKRRELPGLDAEGKHTLIAELHALTEDVDALKTALAERAVGESNDAT